MHAQIVADTLGVPYDCIEVNAADTGGVPDSGPTVASRTCMVVGRILQRCAEEMRARLGRLTPREYLRAARSARHHEGVRAAAARSSWDDDTYRGDAYGSYGWGCDVVEVEVDRDTWEVQPIAFTTVHEIGKAIHPMLADGQIEGGSAQGLGYALLEEVVMRDGRMANASAHQLHHPDDARHAGDRRRDARESVPARPVRREGRRRDADRRPGAGGDQRAAACRVRPARDSGDAGASHGRRDRRASTEDIKDSRESRDWTAVDD